jgi:hypothetical protein
MGNGMVLRDELATHSSYVWERTRSRLEGLDDEEYRWEPAPGCWSLRERPGGRWRVDVVFPTPTPAPFTTIAWRIAHLIQCYGQRRNGLMLGVDDGADDVPWRERVTGGAGDALATLEIAHQRWTEVLAALDDAALGAAIGPVGGEYADASRLGFVLHMLDEFIHHGAEVAALRDLYAATTTPAASPVSVAEAAVLGRWADVVRLLDEGATVENVGTTALHLAAGAGEDEVVGRLLAQGGDRTVRDPMFQQDAAGWARYFGHPDLAARLEG